MPKYLSTAEYAKLIRDDIKAALKSGALPAGLKVSTRTHSYSGGSSITVEVTAVPAGFDLISPARVAHELADPHSWHVAPRGEWCELYTPAGRAVLSTLTAIVNTYHEDNSTDDGGDKCYNVNFYNHIRVDYKLEGIERARVEAQLAAAAADVAATIPAPAAEKPRVYLRAVCSPVDG